MKNKLILAALLLFIQAPLFAQTHADEKKHLNAKAGNWTVVMTLRPAKDAVTVVVKDLTAERKMIGDFCLHETMHPIPGAKTPTFQRLADLVYNADQRRWDYMSIDTRINGGIMNFDYIGSDDSTITSVITNFPHPGTGPDHKNRGLAVYTRNVIVKTDNDHDLVKQYWRLTDQPEWLAVQYEYTRKQ